MKAKTFDKSFAEKTQDTFANHIANLSRMALTTSVKDVLYKSPYTGL